MFNPYDLKAFQVNHLGVLSFSEDYSRIVDALRSGKVMISYEQAIDILESVGTLPRLAVSLDQALGRVCANDLISSIKVSPYRNSAIDGFAIAVKQVQTVPVVLDILGRTAAGDLPASGIGHGAWEIMAGGPLPSGYERSLESNRWIFSTSTPRADQYKFA